MSTVSTIKDIMVHLDGTDEDEVRLAHAEALASSFEAYLTGLYINLIPGDGWPLAPEFLSELLVELQEKTRDDGNRVETRLDQRFQRLAVPNQLKRLDLYLVELYHAIAVQTRCTDLFIASRPYDATGEDRWTGVFETALYHSGRAAYILPPGRQPTAGDSVLVAWNGSRQASRAVAEAIPFMQRAKQVHIALVEDGAAEERGEENGADLARHLSRHGIAVEIRHVADWHRRSAALLNEIERLGCDLVVMGAYGHSRLQEWMLGGVTRDFLKKCPVPMLMAR
ncbi:nucleotide-binding universal stress UspA family protein [Rhodoligotrophos appendicifer]|uniref:universal stress protein n=1 Tax=Rhodoligotrophos appendicifer TaxID=987056 RepID=UPI0011868BAD|nr:universal stress protein [Rhodoligotrophos appendicifer]